MVRDAVLRKVVGAYPLRTVAGPDLPAPLGGLLGGLLLQLHVVELRPEVGHGLGPVLDLRPLVLAGDDDSRRKVGDADRGVRHVDVLSPRAARPVGVDFQVLRADVDLDVVHLGQDGHRSRGGVDAPAGLRHGDPLDAVHPALELELAVGPVAVDAERNLLVPSDAGLVAVDDLHLPALALAEAVVHPVEVGGEESGLLAARPGADLHDDALLVVGVPGQEQQLQFGREALDLRLERIQLVPRQGLHLGVSGLEQLARLLDAGEGGPVLAVFFNHRLELRPPLSQGLKLPGVRGHGGVGHPALDLHKILFQSPQLGFDIHVKSRSVQLGEAADGAGSRSRPRAAFREVRATSICARLGSLVVRYCRERTGAMISRPAAPAFEVRRMIS